MNESQVSPIIEALNRRILSCPDQYVALPFLGGATIWDEHTESLKSIPIVAHWEIGLPGITTRFGTPTRESFCWDYRQPHSSRVRFSTEREALAFAVILNMGLLRTVGVPTFEEEVAQ